MKDAGDVSCGTVIRFAPGEPQDSEQMYHPAKMVFLRLLTLVFPNHRT